MQKLGGKQSVLWAIGKKSIIGGETTSGGQVQYLMMYYLMILDDKTIKD